MPAKCYLTGRVTHALGVFWDTEQGQSVAILCDLFESRVMTPPTSRHISKLYFDGSGESGGILGDLAVLKTIESLNRRDSAAGIGILE